jgi:hypothetical protein
MVLHRPHRDARAPGHGLHAYTPFTARPLRSDPRHLTAAKGLISSRSAGVRWVAGAAHMARSSDVAPVLAMQIPQGAQTLRAATRSALANARSDS